MAYAGFLICCSIISFAVNNNNNNKTLEVFGSLSINQTIG